MRDDLPALSSRLEQTGLRAEGWHTGSSGGEERRDAQHSPESNPQDSNRQHGQDARERQDNPQRRPHRIYEEQPNRKQKGREFAWFMSSLR
ncbi:MAG TPA: hypothetical protein VGH38_08630 [Bryobacteraceae bacterium]